MQLGDPHSVTTLSTVFFKVVTTSPGAKPGDDLRDRVASGRVEHDEPLPPVENTAPRAKSAWPPLEE